MRPTSKKSAFKSKQPTFRHAGGLVTIFLIMFMLSGFLTCNQNKPVEKEAITAEVWLTNLDQSAVFELQDQQLCFQEMETGPLVIEVNPSVTYQTIEGFGYTLTGGSAMLIHQLEPSIRDTLLHELFSTERNGIGISYLRVSIGASDLNDHVFSYNDLPEGETDPQMNKFSLNPDRTDLIPVLKEIIKINPEIKILGSPWSPPVWMKTNRDSRGGSLLKEYYNAYAIYFVKYVRGMKEEGNNEIGIVMIETKDLLEKEK